MPSKTSVIIISDENGTKTLDEYTPVAKAIRLRPIPDWVVMIVTDEKYRTIVSERAKEILFEKVSY